MADNIEELKAEITRLQELVRLLENKLSDQEYEMIDLEEELIRVTKMLRGS